MKKEEQYVETKKPPKEAQDAYMLAIKIIEKEKDKWKKECEEE